MIRYNLFPGARNKAVTMSYDDGKDFDKRLVEIFNRYGIRGTFHLNSGKLDQPGYIRSDEVCRLYQGYEISVHTVNHHDLTSIPPEAAVQEILEDRKRLEQLAGYAVRGMSYPFGTYHDDILRMLPSLGIEYARVTRTTNYYRLPADFLQWEGTCHHNHDLSAITQRFLHEPSRPWWPNLLYVWGHSYEFQNDGNWDMIEEFCKTAGNREDVWYATNMEIVDYVRALRSLKCTVDQRLLFNPTVTDVWVEADGMPVKIEGGQTVRL